MVKKKNRISRLGICRTFTLLLVLAAASSGCAFSRLKTDVATADNSLVLDVQIEMDVNTSGKVLAVVYTPHEDGQRIAAFRIVDPAVQRAILVFESGTYQLAVVHDKNGDLMIDADDAVEMAEGGRTLKFSDVIKRINLKMDLPTKGTLPPKYPRELAALPDALDKDFHFAVGDLMDINDPKFSKDAGRLGLWEPARFLKENGAGVYMLEAFDPQRIPVLFVHGAGGSAQNWRYFFDHLDKSRFQAWFFLYPSGTRIGKVGKALNSLIRTMEKKYAITNLYLVAHSMGGLVSREALVLQLAEEQPLIVKQFITISTPWNGHRMAKKGVEALDVPVPSWHDVVPGSEFLQTVFNTRLKGRVPHHLLFGYQLGSDGDGSVDLNSVLLSEAQDDAVEVRAFEANHVAILSMESVLEYVENILKEDAEVRTKEAASSTAAPSAPEAGVATPGAAASPCTPCATP